MTRPQLLAKIEKIFKDNWLCLDTVTFIANSKGKGYVFDKSKSNEFLSNVLKDLESGDYFPFPF